MDIRINRLELQNFKGLKNLIINAYGKSLNIFGDNATGKTTIFDAFTWLLFGKDSLGSSDFGIKTTNRYGEVIHNLEHSVECELSIDENILTLKRVYAEKWTKKRGSAEADFSGHETKYFINDVPSAKKEYEQKIASVIDEELFKTITNPLYFNEHLKWQDRRTILLSLCSEDLSDETILANTPEYLPLLDDLKGRTIEEYKRIIKGKQSAINSELQAIPQRIAEARLAIPDTIEDVDETNIATHEEKIAEIKDKINALHNTPEQENIDAEIQSLIYKKKEIENVLPDTYEIEAKKRDAMSRLSTGQVEISSLQRELTDCEQYIDNLETRAENLRKFWHEVNGNAYSESELCPTCGQALPEAEVEKAKQKFNAARAEKLETITQDGKKCKATIEEYNLKKEELLEKIKNARQIVDSCNEEIYKYSSLIADKTNKCEETKKSAIAKIDEYIAELKKSTQIPDESIKEQEDMLVNQIAEETAKINQIRKAIAERELIERQQKRIAELSADEKRLAKEYAELEKTAFLLEQFTKDKIKLLSENINKFFKNAKFKLFDVQINGGISECCETTYNGVEYSNLNNAARIQVGIDIIQTLCKHYGKQAVIITDNAESINEIPQTDSQQINLYVSRDNPLRIEQI